MHGSNPSAKRRARSEPPPRKSASARKRPRKSTRAAEAEAPAASAKKGPRKARPVSKRDPARGSAHDLTRNIHSSPPPPPALREWLATKARMHEFLVQRVELEQVDQAARVLLAADRGREPDPIVLDAVAAILDRIAEHACALEFGPNGDQRVAAAEALEEMQALLVKLAEPRRADMVELVIDYAERLRRLGAPPDEAQARAIAQAFIMASTRLDRAFRRLDEGYVREQLARLKPRRTKPDLGACAQLVGAMSAKVGAFSDRSEKRAASAFEKASQRRARGAD